MPIARSHRGWTLIALASVGLLTGCAEGPFSSIGSWTPWVQQKWAEEERYVQSLYGRKNQLRSLASRAPSMSPPEQERVSQDLTNLLREDPITLLRVEVVKTLAVIPTQTASNTLRAAIKDEETDVRIAACEAWGRRHESEAIPALQDVLGSDSDVDVRLAATRALGAFRSSGAVQALGIALDDPDPALQRLAMRSLKNASGQNHGENVVAWREYLRGSNSQPAPANPVARQNRSLF